MRTFELTEASKILEATPGTLRALVASLPDAWMHADEGEGTWSAFDILGHLVHGEQTDWLPRTRLILKDGPTPTFEPFDRFAQLEASRGKTGAQLLDEFADLRQQNLRSLKDLDLSETDLARRGIHPALGEVTLGQLLASWVVHDMGHIRQIARVLAKQYKDEVGPWAEYLPVVSE